MVEANETGSNSSAKDEQRHGLAVHNIYTKDISFESPNVPHVFSLEWDPMVDFDLQMSSHNLQADLWEVVVDITVKVSLRADADKIKTEDPADEEGKKYIAAFLVEVKQAGVFSVVGLSEEQREKVLSTAAPSILFPYAREQVSSAVLKGGFQQLVLPPMNFEAMYQQHLHEKKDKQQASEASKGTSSTAGSSSKETSGDSSQKAD